MYVQLYMFERWGNAIFFWPYTAVNSENKCSFTVKLMLICTVLFVVTALSQWAMSKGSVVKWVWQYIFAYTHSTQSHAPVQVCDSTLLICWTWGKHIQYEIWMWFYDVILLICLLFFFFLEGQILKGKSNVIFTLLSAGFYFESTCYVFWSN